MRRHSWVGFATLIVAAGCASSGGSSSAGSGTAATPGAGAVSAEESTGGTAACASGNCKVTVKISDDISDALNTHSPTYKVYEGCPRLYGVTQDDTTGVSGLKSATPITASPIPLINIPATMKGHIATITMWWGANPQRMYVVDFAQNPSQVINFGYMNTSATSSSGSSGGGKRGGGGNTSFMTGSGTGATGLAPDPTELNKAQAQLHKICK